MMQLLVVLSAVVAGLFLFWAVPFLLRRNPAARWLALFAIGISLNLLSDSLEGSLPPVQPWLLLLLVLIDIVSLMAGTAGLWFHVRLMVGLPVTQTLVRTVSLIILAVLIASPELLSPALLEQVASTPTMTQHDLIDNPDVPEWVHVTGLLQLLAVQAFIGWIVLLCLQAVYRNAPRVGLPDLAIRRLRFLLWTTVVAFGSWVIQYIISAILSESALIAIAVQLGCLMLMGFALGRYGIHYFWLLAPQPLADNSGPTLPSELETPPPVIAKYDRSPLTPAAAQALAERLQAYLRTSEAYRQPGLSLDDLSAALEVTPHALSQAMNQHLQLNFYELVNQYRVQAACQQLADPACRDQSLLAIAYEAGFQSKSTFNSAFKKLVGETPSAYRDRIMTTADAHR